MRAGSSIRADNMLTREIRAPEIHTAEIHFTSGGGFINILAKIKDAPIMLDDIDVLELQARLANTEMVCKELYSVVAKQSQVIHDLWYAPGPGGPGIYEVRNEFEGVQAKEKKEKEENAK